MGHYVLLSQVYPPDPTAIGQHFESAALRLAERGHRVTVFTSDRDYHNPGKPLPPRSSHPSVRVVRLRHTVLGRRDNLLIRFFGESSYLLQVFFRLLFARDIDGVVVTSNPPMTGMMYLKLRIFRRLPMLYWIMEVNPDKAVAHGSFHPDRLPARLVDWSNKRLMRIAQSVVVLDRYMRMRVLRKHCLHEDECGKVEIIAPWPLEPHLRPIPRSENTFIEAHGLALKQCVFMFSGNHGREHPLGTLLAAIRRRRHQDQLAFMFVGGGPGMAAVEAFIDDAVPVNTRCLPYQPLDTLSYSLSAADVQIVVMGENMVGIVHPSKIYGAMAVGRPILFIGPRKSHLGELVSLCNIGWVIEHGEVEKLDSLIEEIAAMPRSEREAIGARGREILQKSYSADILSARFCDLVEGLGQPGSERDFSISTEIEIANPAGDDVRANGGITRAAYSAGNRAGSLRG